jgi:hypothetical protein
MTNPLSAFPFLTISDYWQLNGFFKKEADAMERQQIREALEREASYDQLDNSPF